MCRVAETLARRRRRGRTGTAMLLAPLLHPFQDAVKLFFGQPGTMARGTAPEREIRGMGRLEPHQCGTADGASAVLPGQRCARHGGLKGVVDRSELSEIALCQTG